MSQPTAAMSAARGTSAGGDLFTDPTVDAERDAYAHGLITQEQELTAITTIFTAAKSPITAIVGGSKVSTKLELLESLVDKVDNLVIGGAMAIYNPT